MLAMIALRMWMGQTFSFVIVDGNSTPSSTIIPVYDMRLQRAFAQVTYRKCYSGCTIVLVQKTHDLPVE